MRRPLAYVLMWWAKGDNPHPGARRELPSRKLPNAVTTGEQAADSEGRSVVKARSEVTGKRALPQVAPPVRRGRGMQDARFINPEAGGYPTTEDPDEIRAVVAAGRLSYAHYPYFMLRYGERGEKFTHSDSGWLALLAREDQAHVTEQVTWLGRVLAARGMPRLLLERHLGFLAKELTAVVPSRAESYARLHRAGEALAAERAVHFDDAALEALRISFDDAVGPELSARVPRTGEILGAALADERCGLATAVPAVLGWFRDAVRFSVAWVGAVDALMARARAMTR